MIPPLDNPVMQRALAELLLLAIPAGVLGAWIVLRRLAFFSHSVGPATFPALTIAQATGVWPPALAIAAALTYAAALEWLTRSSRIALDAATGILLVASLALGALLASDVFQSTGQVESLLFGTLLATGSTDLALAGTLALLVPAVAFIFHRTWLAAGFDRQVAGSLGLLNTTLSDRILLLLVAATVVVSVSAVGALMVSALLVVPAATARLVARSLKSLITGSVVLAAGEGFLSIWISYEMNMPPGATLGLLGGTIFLMTTLATRVHPSRLQALLRPLPAPFGGDAD